MKNKNKKKYSSLKISEKFRRLKELEEYGKLFSLRPSRVHESKKKYNRKNNKITNNNYTDE